MNKDFLIKKMIQTNHYNDLLIFKYFYNFNQKPKFYYTVDNTDIKVDQNFKEPELKRFFLLELE